MAGEAEVNTDGFLYQRLSTFLPADLRLLPTPQFWTHWIIRSLNTNKILASFKQREGRNSNNKKEATLHEPLL